MTDGYSGKRVVVTGCASGIGAAVAGALVGQGAQVIGIDRNPGGPATADFIAVDLGDPAAIDAVAARIGGTVDALFNCAGLAPTQPKLAIVKVNFLGLRHLTDALVPMMGAGGAIVSVSSNGGLRWRARRGELLDFLAQDGFDAGLAWFEARAADIANGYSFAKEALTVWTLQQSATLIGHGIRINCTSPGAVQTAMMTELEEHIPAAAIDATTVPIGRRSTPAEQVGPILFLGSSAASYVNGVDLSVDGGFGAMVALGE